MTISMLDYVVRNFPTHGDPMLEETRQAALRELDKLYGQLRGQTRREIRSETGGDLQMMVLGRLYRGTLIFALPDGKVLILGESGHRYIFVDQPEAEAFVDSCLVMSGSLIGTLA